MSKNEEKQKAKDMDEARIECVVTGRVQMVMFRDFVCRKARGLGLVGTVENQRNGSVQVIAEGKVKNLEQLIEKLHEGSIAAKVENVEVEWLDAPGEESFENFQIVY